MVCLYSNKICIIGKIIRIRLIWESRYAPRHTSSARTTDSRSIKKISNSDAEDDLDFEIYGKRRKLLDKDQDELTHYLSEEEIDDKIDVLRWWKLQENGSYPNLAQMARDYLSIPASSAATERSFSVAGNLITENRSCLSPETVRALMCIKSWRKSGLIGD